MNPEEVVMNTIQNALIKWNVPTTPVFRIDWCSSVLNKRP